MAWYRFHIHKTPLKVKPLTDSECPLVTIQLPIYNERYVAERLIECVVNLDYPPDKLYIQVLDDSRDNTKEIVQGAILQHCKNGLDIEHICRPERMGYKGGALEYGLKKAKGNYLAIFDADFQPSRDFLKNTLAYVINEQNVGCIQTRWGHLNREASWLTRAQASGIDGHFFIEQEIRSGTPLFLNFNGTAGIWRRDCIIDAGGWHHDTLTEDLDLSFRAQLKGWKILYTPHVVTPAELPTHIRSLKQQQFRWAKGSIQTTRKLIKELWRSSQPILVKIASTIHLTNYLVHPLMLLNLLLHVPIILFGNILLLWIPIFFLAAIGPSLMYWLALREQDKSVLDSLQNLLMLIILGVGMNYNNTRAVVEAIFSIESPFKRTPKFNLKGKQQFSGKSDYQLSVDFSLWIESALALLSIFLLLYSISNGIWGGILWMLPYACGYSYVTITNFQSQKAL